MQIKKKSERENNIMAGKQKLSLEEAMARLEEIAKELENEKLPLEASVKLYEEGVSLVARCAEELESAKNRIKILQQGKNGEIELADVPEDVFGE